jgi:hypothetical protein
VSEDDEKIAITPAWLNYKQSEAYSGLSRTTLWQRVPHQGLFFFPVFSIGKPLRNVEPRGIEPLTSALPARRSPS